MSELDIQVHMEALNKFQAYMVPIREFIGRLGNRAEKVTVGNFFITVAELKALDEYASYKWRKLAPSAFWYEVHHVGKPYVRLMNAIQQAGKDTPDLYTRRVKITFQIMHETKVVEGFVIRELANVVRVLLQMKPANI